MSRNAHTRSTSRTTTGLIAFAVLILLLVFAGAALAQQDPYPEDEPTVLPTIIERVDPDDDDDEVLGEVVERPGILPITGGDLTLFVATGTALIATGIVIRRVRKRDT